MTKKLRAERQTWSPLCHYHDVCVYVGMLDRVHRKLLLKSKDTSIKGKLEKDGAVLHALTHILTHTKANLYIYIWISVSVNVKFNFVCDLPPIVAEPSVHSNSILTHRVHSERQTVSRTK